MKKLKKFRVKSAHDDSPKAASHIDSLRILAFAKGDTDFTEKENTHFDVCRACRLKVLNALKNVEPKVTHTTASKAA